MSATALSSTQAIELESNSTIPQMNAQSQCGDSVSPERIAELAHNLAGMMAGSIKEIASVNGKGRILSLNARIEAARAGEKLGAAFGVVAEEMQELSNATAQVTTDLSTGANQAIAELQSISEALATNVRGLRLSDLALVNIDLIDRCLYERTCDVRWWATDSSVVDALASNAPETRRHASRRLGVILDAYTVYFDLVLCDMKGQVIANGRPESFGSQGMNVAASKWFRAAAASSSGNEYGFEPPHQSGLVNGKRVAIYSCSVRENGDAHGKVIGVLGILFNWDGLAQAIVKNTPLAANEKENARVMIVDDEGLILADSAERQLSESLPTESLASLFSARKKTFATVFLEHEPHRAGYAYSPGFETYATGWHSLILQPLG